MSVNPAGAAAAESSGAGIIPTVSAAVTQPAAKASHLIYEAVAGGVQWYVEQWEDVFVEAKAMRATGHEGLTAPDILAGLAEAKVISELPGRVRLRTKQLKWQGQLAEESAQALASLPGIRRAEVSPVTGSVLIFYDTTQYASRDALLGAVAPSTQND